MRRSDARAQLARAALVAEVLFTYALVRWHVRRQDLPTAVAALRTRRRLPRALDRDERRLAAGAERVVAKLPGDSRCLMRSLVVLTMLARRGIDARLVLAARPEPMFGAHAWIERGGEPLLPTRGFADARLTDL
jgi:Transglutaminase-like superfamily